MDGFTDGRMDGQDKNIKQIFETRHALFFQVNFNMWHKQISCCKYFITKVLQTTLYWFMVKQDKNQYASFQHTEVIKGHSQFKSPHVRKLAKLIRVQSWDYFGETWRGSVVRGGTPLEVALSVYLDGGRDYLDVTRSGFLVRGGVLPWSVSVVNLIRAGERRWSSREQVPLTAELSSPLWCLSPFPLTFYFLLFVLLLPMCVISPHFSCRLTSRLTPAFICLCLSCNQLWEWRRLCGTFRTSSLKRFSIFAAWLSLTFWNLMSHHPLPVHCTPASYVSTPLSVLPTCLDQSSQTQNTDLYQNQKYAWSNV